MSPEEATRPSLDAKGIKCVQAIVGKVLFYRRAVDNKLVVALNYIGTQQSSSTESTNETINHLLNYLSTYPNDIIVYRSSNKGLAAHSDAGFHNESNCRSRYRARIFLAGNESVPLFNGIILTIAQVIKFVISSSAEAELGAIFITLKELVPIL